MKSEPMALATGVAGPDVVSLRPAASAVGSHNRTMQSALVLVFSLVLCVTPSTLAADPISIDDVQRKDAVSFEKEILPILQQNCLACHSASEKEGNLVLESPQGILKGGDTGTAAVPGRAAESLILALASHAKDPVMPPAENDVAAKNLTPAELGLLKLWIDQGAKGTGGIDSLSPKQWHRLPAGVHPVQAIALTEDGQFVACSRANQIFLYHVPTGQLVTKLADSSLDTEHTTGIAHRDMVQSLAFNVDGDLLASGGFREVKLWRRPRDVHRLNLALGAAATAVAVSPDQQWIATAGADHTIKLFQTGSGQPGPSLSGHTDTITSLRFTSDGKRIFSGSLDQTVRSWEVADGKPQGMIETPAAVNAIECVNRDQPTEENPIVSQLLVTGDVEKTIRIWEFPEAMPAKIPSSLSNLTKTTTSRDGSLMAMLDNNDTIRVVSLSESNGQPLGKELATWKVDRGVTAFAFVPLPDSPPESTKHALITGAADGSLRIWSLPEHAIIGEWSGEAKSAAALAVSADGKMAASGSENGAITLWDLSPPAPPDAVEIRDTNSPIEITTLSPSRKQLAFVGVKDGKPAVFVRNLENGQLVATFVGHSAAIRSISFSTDESRLVSGGDDKTIRLWDLKDPGKGEIANVEVPTNITAVAANQDGRQVLAGFADNALWLCNVADGEVTTEFAGNGGAIIACGFYANQPFSVATDKSVRFWNAADGAQTRTFNAPAGITTFAISADGSRMAFGGDDKEVRIVQSDNGAVLQTLTPFSEIAISSSFSVDAQRLSVLTKNGQLSVWNVADGRIRESFVDANISSAWFAADASMISTGGKAAQLAKHTLRFIRHVDGNTQAITDMLFHSNGQILFTTAADGSLRGYNTQNGQQTFATSHGSAVHDLAISPNEQVLATAGENAIVRLWQTNGGAFGPQQLVGFQGPVNSVGFSPDSAKVIAGSLGDKPETRVYELPSGLLLQRFTQQSGAIVSCSALAGATPVANQAAKLSLLTASASGLYRWTATSVRQIAGHSQSVTSLAADPERVRHIYSGSLDGTTRRWNLDNGQAVGQFNHGGGVTAISVCPDGTRIASASENRVAKLFRTNGQQIAELRGDVRLKVSHARAQQQLGSANARLNVAKRIFDEAEMDVPKKTEAEKKLADELAAANKEVTEKQAAVDKSLTDKIAAEKAAIEASAAAKSALADKEQAELLAKNAAATMNVAQGKMTQLQRATAENPDNEQLKQLLATAQTNLTTCQQKSQELTAAIEEPTAKAAEMATAANTAATKVNEVQKPYNDATTALKTALAKQNLLSQQRALAEKELKDAQDLVPIRKEAHTRAETAKADAEKAVTAANELLKESEQPIRSIAFSPDGSVLATAGDFLSFHTWDGQTGAAIAAFAGHSNPIRQIAFLDAHTIVSASDDQSCRVWDLNPSWVLEKTIGNVDDPNIITHRATAVDFNRESTQLLVAGGIPSRSGELHVFDVADGSRAFYLPRAHDDVIYAARFSPDGKHVASGAADKYLRTFDVMSSTQLRRFEGHTNYVLGVSWKSDGETIATSSADNTIKIWEAETGDQRRTIDQQLTKHVTAVQFIGDSSNVVSSSGDKRVRIHNSDNGGVARNFSDVKSWLHCVAVTPDSKIVAAGDASGTLTIWNGTNGQLIRQLSP